MITAYHRPETLTDALDLLARRQPETLPIGGGTVLSRLRTPDIEVVDLQLLGLDGIAQEGQQVIIGATTRLQALLEHESFPYEMSTALRESIRHEQSLNIRQMATVAGSIVGCDGRSPFITALLALDPHVDWMPGPEQEALGDYLALRDATPKRLMISVRLPLNARLRFDMVARTPYDLPIVCAAVASWPSGRTRVAVGGYGKAPILAMDGPQRAGAEQSAREAYRHAEDVWASAAYRSEVAGILVRRMLK